MGFHGKEGMAGRPKAVLMLSAAEQEQLHAWARRRKTAQALALRSRIVLECAGGAENKAVAAKLAVTGQTVSKWRTRFVQMRLDGMLDAPRSEAPRTIDDARVDAVIAKTLEQQPSNATHWSTRAMAREAGLSQTAVSRIWRAFGLQQHRQETFKLSTMDDAVWDHSVFSKNRDRLLAHEAVATFFTEVMTTADKQGLLSREHFSFGSTLIQA